MYNIDSNNDNRTILYKNVLISKIENNYWYISKEVVKKKNKVMSSEYIILFDKFSISCKGENSCDDGDIIYVIRKKRLNIPILSYLEKENQYTGSKEIIDNTDKYQ